MRLKGQERAAFALKNVTSCNCRDKYKPLTASAPSMILQNGFGQSIAFWMQKGEPQHLYLLNTLRIWLVEHCQFAIGNTISDLIEYLSSEQCGQAEYFKNQQEALKLLEWVKRFANADL